MPDKTYAAVNDGSLAADAASLGHVNTMRADARAMIYADLFPFVPASIADVGCGVGLTTAAMKRRFPDADVVGYEMWAEATAYATRTDQSGARYATVEAAEGVALDRTFDAMILQEFYPLTRTGDFSVHRGILSFIADNLAPRGFAFVQLAVRHPEDTILNTLPQTRAFCAERGLAFSEHDIPYDRLVDMTGSVGLARLLTPLASAIKKADRRVVLMLRA